MQSYLLQRLREGCAPSGVRIFHGPSVVSVFVLGKTGVAEISETSGSMGRSYTGHMLGGGKKLQVHERVLRQDGKYQSTVGISDAELATNGY